MHDLWFAGKIIALLKEKMGVGLMPKQVIVGVTLGPFTHVTEKSLLAAFDILSKEEGFQNASLNIKKDKPVVNCKKCKASTEITKPIAQCPKCGCDDFGISNTEEFVINSIEII